MPKSISKAKSKSNSSMLKGLFLYTFGSDLLLSYFIIPLA